MQTIFTLQELRDKFASEIRYHRQERDILRQEEDNIWRCSMTRFLSQETIKRRIGEREMKAKEHKENQRALIDMADRIGLRDWRGRHPAKKK